jgi:subtilisin family serine protease
MGNRIVLFVAFLSIVAFDSAGRIDEWQQKVDPRVIESAEANGATEFLVYLDEQADLSGAFALESKQEKGAYVFNQLTEVALRTQKPLLDTLETWGVDYRPFWVTNMVWVSGDSSILEEIAKRSDVAYIHANPEVRLDIADTGPLQLSGATVSGVEWNISRVNAPSVWAMTFRGQGVVVGGQDTGYDWDHPALINQYRGWEDGQAEHDYNWHDAIHSGGGICGSDSTEPCDDHNHGTHTMGIMVGDDGGSNQIGVAPGAKWIGCRNMDRGVGTPATYSECYQWFIAPTDLNDANSDPSKAPDVINNSWSCPPSEGCTEPDILLAVVDNVRAAGILTVHSAGNSGSSCSSVNAPAAIYDSSFTVGATNISDLITTYSSRGPVTVDGSMRLKPDVSAPGGDGSGGIRSSIPGGGYATFIGTSMAAPHVAGLAALLMSADPTLAGRVDEIERTMETTAIPKTTSQTCGAIGGNQVPNNTYGYGLVDSRAATAETFPHRHYLPMQSWE